MAFSTTKQSGLGLLSAHYQVILCDIWGVVHNGVAAWPFAVDALEQARKAGLRVILLSNAPRPNAPVRQQLASLGVKNTAYDQVITSGDVTRNYLSRFYKGKSLYHLGPMRDAVLYEGLDITLEPVEQASAILCTGPFDDDKDKAEDYYDVLSTCLSLKLPLICANPDKVVEKGGRIIPCAGAIADLYAGMKGEVIMFGKPHQPIYEEAFIQAQKLCGQGLQRADILAIGDSLCTDLQGAHDFGCHSLFITAGIHAEEFGNTENPDAMRVEAFIKQSDLNITAWQSYLKW